MSEVLNHEILAAQINTQFELIDASEPFALELIEVTEPIVTKSQTYFSLFFRGSKNLMAPQGTYRIKHARLGELILFIVPTAQEADGFRYEAVFNLLNDQSQKSGE